VDQQGALQLRPRLQLGQQAVHVVDVPGAFDLGHHDHLQHVPDLSHQLGEVVQDPGALQGVDPSPERRAAQIGLLGDLDQPLPGSLFFVRGDGVLQVSEQDVGAPRHLRHLGRHLLVGGIE
jgi:hypothetical protein